MIETDFLIIGGSAAGTTAAEVIRGLLPDASIKIITDENHEQYSRVLIPHYIRHKVTRDQVFLKKPQWYGDKKIELIKGVGAQKLDWKNHLVRVSNGDEYQYGKLLIAIGGKVIPFDAPGAYLENILYMRTIEDADKIRDLASKSKKAVIVGGGFIGLEFCSCFKANGVSDVTVLVLEDYYWQGKLDRDSSRVLQNTLERNGIRILTNEEVKSFEPSNKIQEGRTLKGFAGIVKTKSGESFEADVVGIGVGVRSDLSWLAGSGIKTNRAIVTNEYLESNLPDIYAAGDCAEFYDVVFERQHIMGNWANATSQGNVVGKNMALSINLGSLTGQKTVFETASSYSINYFNGSCTFIGVTDDKFADEVICRGSVEAGKMTRIYVKTINKVMRIVGATIINNPAEVAPLTSTIKNKINISDHKDSLQDLGFDLKNLIIQSGKGNI